MVARTANALAVASWPSTVRETLANWILVQLLLHYKVLHSLLWLCRQSWHFQIWLKLCQSSYGCRIPGIRKFHFSPEIMKDVYIVLSLLVMQLWHILGATPGVNFGSLAIRMIGQTIPICSNIHSTRATIYNPLQLDFGRYGYLLWFVVPLLLLPQHWKFELRVFHKSSMT